MDNIFDLVDLGNNAKLVIKKMFESKFPDTYYIYDKKNNNLFIKRHKLELDILISPPRKARQDRGQAHKTLSHTNRFKFGLFSGSGIPLPWDSKQPRWCL